MKLPADGEAVWSWLPDAEVKSANACCGWRGLTSPAPRGEHGI